MGTTGAESTAMSKRQAIGGRVLAAREASGLSLWRAARRLGVNPWALQGWEQGRVDVPLDVRHAMAALYGTAPHYLVPDRPTAVVQDGVKAVVRIGSVAFTLDGSDEHTLRRFLAAVREERGVVPGTPMAVRETDAALLADLLGGSAEDIASSLRRLLGISGDEADELSSWLFGQTAVGAALTMDLGASPGPARSTTA
jgi:transcriptional regulator with XRE-family HTH domain